MAEPKDGFRQAVERVVWAHSNVSKEERAEVLREYAEELEMEDSPFDDMGEHVRKTLRNMGYDWPDDLEE